jgi:sigma-B regulation protein RsbU (phosphoserine phosphatase)
MLSTIEKVIILKQVSIFAETPDEILAEVALLLQEVESKSGGTVFEKGDLGDCMYIIVDGQVRVHDRGRTLNHLGEGDVFGEMALVDSQPRLASVTAVEDTRLLRLDQESFYRLMDERSEVARGIIRVLSRHLRARVHDLADLRTHLENVILPLGIALSSEDNLDRLLERILLEAKSFCNADAGTLYLLTDDDCLRFAIMRSDMLDMAVGGTTGRHVPFPPLCLYDEETGEPNHQNVSTHTALDGQSIHIPDIYHTAEFDFSGTKAFDKANNYRSVSTFTVPLKDHTGKVIGVLQLFNAQDPGTGRLIPFDAYQQLVVESLASQAAVALNTQELLRRQEKLLRFEHDLQVGRKIQADFFPRELPQPHGWEIAARFQPAHEVAGDFYDVFPLADGRIGLLIADVVDKGVGAALFMVLSRSLIRAYGQLAEQIDNRRATATSDEGQTLPAINTRALNAVRLTSDYIAQNHGHMSMFVTLFFAVLDLDTGLLTYINAGHNPPYLVGPTGIVKADLVPTGPAAGLFANVVFNIQQVTLEPGDLLATFTDGVTEARDPNGDFFGEERLLSLLKQPAPSASEHLDRIEASLQAYTAGASQLDDITMLAVMRVANVTPPATADPVTRSAPQSPPG